jgi:protein-tyrosine sulfotransferase
MSFQLASHCDVKRFCMSLRGAKVTVSLQNNRISPKSLGSSHCTPNKVLKMLAWRFPRIPSTQRHIFIIGAPRSGTTLLEAILAVHPNFSSLHKELAIFSFRNIFELERLAFSITETATTTALFQKSADIVEFYDKLAESVLSIQGGKRFLEKTPQNVLHLAFLRNSFPNAQFINIVRDGRDCYCSAQDNPYVIQSKSVERYAKYWRRCVESRIAFGHDPNIIDIRYEELTSDAVGVTKNLMHFLGEEFLPEQLQTSHYSQHNASKVPFFQKLTCPIDTSSHNQWQTELTKREIKTFERIAGSHLVQLGYALSEGSTSRVVPQDLARLS